MKQFSLKLFSKIEVVDRIVNLMAGINRHAIVQIDFCAIQKTVSADKSGLNTLAVDSRIFFVLKST